MKWINYDTNQFNFLEIISNYLKVKDLSLIHQDKDFNYYTKFNRETDQQTHYHKLYYELSRTEEFTLLYTKFILEVIKPQFGEDIVYQTIPTFRLHFPGNIAVGEYHRDRNYRDENWASEVKELNFFLPFTDAYETNTIWVESEEGKEDFSPVKAKYGQVVMWDGANLLHGNKTNEESTTRVSCDFRVMPVSRYKPSEHGSINTKSKFQIGGYYSQT